MKEKNPRSPYENDFQDTQIPQPDAPQLSDGGLINELSHELQHGRVI